MKKIFLTIVMIFVRMLCFTGCKNNEMAQQSSTQQSIDNLPELNGKYAYLRVNVLSKDTEGELDCSDLLIMGGIKEGNGLYHLLIKDKTHQGTGGFHYKES